MFIKDTLKPSMGALRLFPTAEGPERSIGRTTPVRRGIGDCIYRGYFFLAQC